MKEFCTFLNPTLVILAGVLFFYPIDHTPAELELRTISSNIFGMIALYLAIEVFANRHTAAIKDAIKDTKESERL